LAVIQCGLERLLTHLLTEKPRPRSFGLWLKDTTGHPFMKAAPFDYVLAQDMDEALSLIDQHGPEAKLIAGGQSLVPMMAMRLARPQWLVDINRLSELKQLDMHAKHVLIGAGVRQRDLEFNTQLYQHVPLLKHALSWVGHIQTRNRGTLGGSLVYADPSAELPLSALILNAKIHLQSKNAGAREVLAEDFFLGPMFTAIADNECLSAIEWPIWSGPHIGVAFEETAIRKGDFAMASAACQIQLDRSGVIKRVSFGLGGVDGTPRVFPHLATQMMGQKISDLSMQDIAQAAIQECDPSSDMHASSAYRKHLAQTLLCRATHQAAQMAQGHESTSPH
jgi:carbon-monoxide dehydrogenase medium subunit